MTNYQGVEQKNQARINGKLVCNYNRTGVLEIVMEPNGAPWFHVIFFQVGGCTTAQGWGGEEKQICVVRE